MVNSRAASGILKLIEKHTAGSAAASKTFTISPAADMLSSYSELVLIIAFEATATFDLELKLNGFTTFYNWSAIQNDAGTVSGLTGASAAHFEIMPTEIIVAGDQHYVRVHITLTDDGTDRDIVATWESDGADEGNTVGGGRRGNDSQVTTISEIIVETSTSTWKAGCNITLYGLTK